MTEAETKKKKKRQTDRFQIKPNCCDSYGSTLKKKKIFIVLVQRDISRERLPFILTDRCSRGIRMCIVSGEEQSYFQPLCVIGKMEGPAQTQNYNNVWRGFPSCVPLHRRPCGVKRTRSGHTPTEAISRLTALSLNFVLSQESTANKRTFPQRFPCEDAAQKGR